MLYLVAVVTLNVVIFVLFRLFPRFGINALVAIVANYWICTATGLMCADRQLMSHGLLLLPWLPWSVLTGVSFITIFNITAWCTRTHGMTSATVASKLSLVISAALSIFLYHESVGLGKVMGILLAAPSIYFSTRTGVATDKKQGWQLPVVLFFSSGLLDALMKYVQHTTLPRASDQAAFTLCTFAAAGIIGTLIVITLAAMHKLSVDAKSIAAGMILGVPNFFSIYFFIRMLDSKWLQSSATIPVANMGTVVVATIVGLIIFRERASAHRTAGLLLSLIAILLIAFSDHL